MTTVTKEPLRSYNDYLLRAADVLFDVERLIQDDMLCQNDYARTADGEPTYALHGAAVQWCAIGAMIRCSERAERMDWIKVSNIAVRTFAEVVTEAVPDLKGLPPASSVVNHWNDMEGRTAEEVRAIAHTAAQKLLTLWECRVAEGVSE